jgi:hypothetical protein
VQDSRLHTGQLMHDPALDTSPLHCLDWLFPQNSKLIPTEDWRPLKLHPLKTPSSKLALTEDWLLLKTGSHWRLAPTEDWLPLKTGSYWKLPLAENSQRF